MLIVTRKLGEQKMADLPNDRTIDEPPFTNCGVDMFGPFLIKEERKELKRFGALFTCLSSRAVHIECTCSLETDSFIQTCVFLLHEEILECCVVTMVLTLWEHKRNWKRHTKKWIIRRLNSSFRTLVQINQLAQEPPSTKPYGGCLGRQIHSVRTILMSFLHTNRRSLNDESLKTILAETEAIVNSRPLTVDTLEDVQSEQPIGPSNILTMKSKVVLRPPGHFVNADEYSRKRWRRIEHIANEFWVRWQKEFPWSLNRNQWPMGKVVGIN